MDQGPITRGAGAAPGAGGGRLCAPHRLWHRRGHRGAGGIRGGPGFPAGPAAVQADRARRRRRRRHGGGHSRLADRARPGGQPARASGTDPRVVIIGSGLAGLGCAYRPVGRPRHSQRCLRVQRGPARRPRLHPAGFFDAGQYAEQHGEFISSEHTATRRLATRLRPHPGQHGRPTRRTPTRHATGSGSTAVLAAGRAEPGLARVGLAAVPRRRLPKAPWPTLYNKHTPWGLRWDHMPATEWIEQPTSPAASDSDFGALCVSILLDEYGGPDGMESALNLVYLLGLYDSSPSGHAAPQGSPATVGHRREVAHAAAATTSSSPGLIERLPAGHRPPGRAAGGGARPGHGRYASRSPTAQEPTSNTPITWCSPCRSPSCARWNCTESTCRRGSSRPSGTSRSARTRRSRCSSPAGSGTPTTGPGTCTPTAIVQGGWETTVDQPGTQGILIALPGGESSAPPRPALRPAHATRGRRRTGWRTTSSAASSGTSPA